MIVQWVSTRGWFQTKDLEVHELLAPGNVILYLGYQDFVLTWKKLKSIFAAPRAHRD